MNRFVLPYDSLMHFIKRLRIIIFILFTSQHVFAQAPVFTAFFPSSAGLGVTVTITGSNLFNVTNISFGGIPASTIFYFSDNTMYASVGNGASGSVTLTYASGSISLPGFIFLPPPVVTSFTPSSGGTGDTITIKGQRFSDVYDVEFGNIPALSASVVSDTVITAVVNEGATGDVSVTGTNGSGSASGFTFLNRQPVITGISPVSGPIGTSVVINGSGFSTIPLENIVYFGAVKATVNAATSNSLTVTVPVGATFQPISVTRPQSHLTAYWQKPFIVTFQGAGTSFSAASFADQLKFSTPGINPSSIYQADFDGDGKTDIAIAYGFFGTPNNMVSVYRNISSNGIINFAAPVDIIIGNQSNSGYDVKAADIDGDGKQDLVTVSSGDNIVSILLNTSTVGNISFASRQDFITGSDAGPDGTNPVNVTVSDFDGDGKPDLAFANFGIANWCKVSYLRNTSVNGQISFSGLTNISIIDAWGVYSTDLNNDNKPDMAVDVNQSSGFVEVATIRNISTSGSISLQPNGGFGAHFGITGGVAFGDLDNDGKMDMVSGTRSSAAWVFRNVSVNGDLVTFATPQSIPVNFSTTGTAVTDMDGDGKPDILVSCNYSNLITILKNSSTPGTISLAPKVDYATGNSPAEIAAADLDGDGLPEIITTNSSDTTFTVYKNKINAPIDLCPPNSNSTIVCNITGTNYQWQVSSDNGITFVDLVNGSFYSGVLTSALQLANVPSSFSGLIYRCKVNGAYSMIYKLRFVNHWTGAISSFWDNPGNWSCNTIPDGNTDVYIETGNVIVNTNAAVCSMLTILPGAGIHVNTGALLIMTH